MRTVEIYTFDELEKEVQEKVLKNFDYQADFDYFTEDCIEQIKNAGFIEPEVKYSLSCSQGDGLSFKAKKIDFDVVFPNLTKRQKFILENCRINIYGNVGRYCFCANEDVELILDSYEDYPLIELKVDEFRKILISLYINLCKKLEKDGYEALEWEQSDENKTEIIKGNDYEFTKNGVRI